MEESLSRSDIATLCGEGTKVSLLEKPLESGPASFVAMTGSDETNLVACSIAKHLGYERTIARVRDENFQERGRIDFGRLFFVDHFIDSELLAAHGILKNLLYPEDVSMEHFAHGNIQMRSLKVPFS